MKKIVLLKERGTKIKLSQNYIEVFSPTANFVIAKKFVKEFYIYKAIKIPISTYIELLSIAPLFFIDNNGYIKAELKRVENAET